MIKSIDLANAVHEEAHGIASRIPESETPHLRNGDRLAWLLAHWPLPTVKEMIPVIEEVFWASLLTEEGRPCRPRLLYSTVVDTERPVHWFSEPIPLNRESLRKLTSIQDDTCYLVWKIADHHPVMIGLQARESSDPNQFLLTCAGPGALDFTWNRLRVVILREGYTRRLSSCTLPDSHVVFEMIRTLLGSFEPFFLGRVVRAISDQGHGGSLWIVREGTSVSDIQIGHRIVRDGRLLLDRFPRFESRHPWLNSIAQLTAVDGAVLLDSRVRVLGFGAFISVNEPSEIIRRLPGGDEQKVSSFTLGGGRHRSAVEFCKRFAPAAAIVVSEDGRILVIAAPGEAQPPWCAEIASLGFSDSL